MNKRQFIILIFTILIGNITGVIVTDTLNKKTINSLTNLNQVRSKTENDMEKQAEIKIGGIVGESIGGSIENSNSEGQIFVEGKSNNVKVGGIAGSSKDTKIIDSKSNGRIEIVDTTSELTFWEEHVILAGIFSGLIVSSITYITGNFFLSFKFVRK